MAKFSEVMRQWRRMCDAMETTAGEGYGCDICPVNNATDTMGCGAIFDMPPETNWEGMAEKIMRWAADHQEPVYPSWFEWLESVGVAGSLPEDEPYYVGSWEPIYLKRAAFTPKAFEPIPADIAQKLGIEPKEASADEAQDD